MLIPMRHVLFVGKKVARVFDCVTKVDALSPRNKQLNHHVTQQQCVTQDTHQHM